MSRRVHLAYIAGTSYCGSTLASFLLNAHPQILSVGEPVAGTVREPAAYMCSCGRRLADCPFFGSVQAQLDRNGVDFDAIRNYTMNLYRVSDVKPINRVVSRAVANPVLARLRGAIVANVPPFASRIATWGALDLAFMRASLDVSQKQIFLDGSKDVEALRYLLRLDAEVSIIHLVRDPRAYCFSRLRRQDTPSSVRRHAAGWVRTNKAIQNICLQSGSPRSIIVTYEQLATSPADTFRALTDFLGVSPAPFPDDFRAGEQHILGNRMRMRVDERSIRLDETWKTAISSSDARTIAKVAGPFARKLGYSI